MPKAMVMSSPLLNVVLTDLNASVALGSHPESDSALAVHAALERNARDVKLTTTEGQWYVLAGAAEGPVQVYQLLPSGEPAWLKEVTRNGNETMRQAALRV